MAGLMAAADIVISLHRSEGFGLVPAQAMALGKPVVATAWSGNLEFMTKRQFGAGVLFAGAGARPGRRLRRQDQIWADADIDHAADWLRRLAGGADLRARMGAAAAKDVDAQLAPGQFARAVAGLIEAGGAPQMSPLRASPSTAAS